MRGFALIGLLVMGWLLGSADRAHATAKWTRNSATYCQSIDPDDPDLHWSAYGAYTNDGYAQLYCPIKDTWDFPKTQLDHINVHVYDNGSGSTTARACATSAFALFAACEVGPTTSGTGNKTLHIASNQIDFLTASNNHTYFAYLYITMGPRQYVKGYWTSN
jgi:hypothetical protein